MRPLAQISRFGTVGIVASGVHVAIGMAAYHWAGLEAFTANLLAFTVALCVSYAGQTALAFPGARRSAQSFSRFVAVAVIGLALNQAIVVIVTRWLAAPYWVALATIVTTVPALTFVALKFWALRQ